MTKRILIIGGGGFVGGHLINEAIALQYEVWVSVRNRNTLSPDVKQECIHCINLPINDPELLRKQIQIVSKQIGGWHYIIHNLGLTKTTHPQLFLEVNYQYMRNVVDAIIAENALLNKFIFISSLGAMGPGNPNGTPIQPNDTPHPNTLYGQSKLKAEQYLHSLPHLQHLIIRPTGIYGPNDMDYLTLIRGINCGIALQAGYTDQLISFTYVKDMVQCIFLLMNHVNTNATFCISDNRIYTMDEFNQLVKQILHRRTLLTLRLPKWIIRTVCFASEHLGRLFGINPLLTIDKSKIMCAHNWSCDCSSLYHSIPFSPTPLDQGLRQTIEWYRRHHFLPPL